MGNLQNAANLSTIKTSNRSLILRTINAEGQVSRAELSRITGLTKTSITNIITELLGEGLVMETEAQESQNGRRPILLYMNKDALYALGVYISRDFVHTSMVNLRGEILCETRYAFELTENEVTFMEIITQQLEEMTAHTGILPSKILGIGIASIGPLDTDQGIILDPPNFRGLKSIPIVERLTQRFPYKVILENDMNASAVAEKLFGDARQLTDFIYIGITNGIGAGIIVGNHLFKGADGFAGEIGHTTIDIHGEQCPCGNLGCLELYTSIPHTINRVKASIQLGMETAAAYRLPLTWPDLVELARAGDDACKNAIHKLVYYLSVGLVNLIHTFDPQVIFLGHEIALAGDLVMQPLEELVNANILFRKSKRVEVRVSCFGEAAPSIGAASMVLERFYSGAAEK